MTLLYIRILCKRKSIDINDLATSIGMTLSDLNNCIQNNTIDYVYLERIAHALNVPISYFSDERQKQNNNNVYINGNNNVLVSGGSVSITIPKK